MITAARAQRSAQLMSHVPALLLMTLAGGAALWWTHSVVELVPLSASHLVGWALAFLVSRTLSLHLPQGDRVQITLMVGLVGVVLRGATEIVAAAALAGTLDYLSRSRQMSGAERAHWVVDSIRSVLVIALVAPGQVLLRSSATASMSDDFVLVMVLIVGAIYALLDLLTIAIQERLAGGAGIADGIVLLTRPLGSVYMVHIALAAVVVRIYPSLGLWGFAIALLLTLILQNSFSLYLKIRRAYAQTIGALAHAAELDRPDDTGHARRVADLAVSVGREMGMSSLDLERIGYAALLHDIGRIGGDRHEQDSTHPERGAAIVSDVPFLEGVAPLIAHYRDAEAEDVPVGAMIVGVCCRLDRLSLTHERHLALELLERTERSARSDVVAALRKALERDSFGMRPVESTS